MTPEEQLTKLLKQNQNIVFGKTIGTDPDGNCTVQSDGGMILAKSGGRISAGDCVALKTDDGQWYAVSARQSGTIEQKTIYKRKSVPISTASTSTVIMLFKKIIAADPTTVPPTLASATLYVGGDRDTPEVIYNLESGFTWFGNNPNINKTGSGQDDWIVSFILVSSSDDTSYKFCAILSGQLYELPLTIPVSEGSYTFSGLGNSAFQNGFLTTIDASSVVDVTPIQPPLPDTRPKICHSYSSVILYVITVPPSPYYGSTDYDGNIYNGGTYYAGYNKTSKGLILYSIDPIGKLPVGVFYQYYVPFNAERGDTIKFIEFGSGIDKVYLLCSVPPGVTTLQPETPYPVPASRIFWGVPFSYEPGIGVSVDIIDCTLPTLPERPKVYEAKFRSFYIDALNNKIGSITKKSLTVSTDQSTPTFDSLQLNYDDSNQLTARIGIKSDQSTLILDSPRSIGKDLQNSLLNYYDSATSTAKIAYRERNTQPVFFNLDAFTTPTDGSDSALFPEGDSRNGHNIFSFYSPNLIGNNVFSVTPPTDISSSANLDVVITSIGDTISFTTALYPYTGVNNNTGTLIDASAYIE
ncbi:hypothetical protein [Pseudanabaena sp. 'Roaring Creek']|uniref:hypothetical protein n=1 Tax=Pseudanabaena sp. 'Roaring Creek' TaxID=1681830 RepID=UPI0006D85E3B|nr:hypothetical protein [Pseudanabaena sp. 'Roaring Creek']